ncbi:aminotransferase class I/II-fold pyridoxal phosphate-dependent enzyme [Calidifontibacter sp. DB0510]|uniref:8-amino-7-oxononanoate synthase n=1 Tax=Metallococcus carri TaxID=1656884 RepID=A0A967B9D4_9MICO|nr:aminotransferase class I/II-fold pyridoxal phosphate-dependent enzyme [Metallococcus carri]NHN57251.1 aminotransferase class I/II-fold pyridoxal phosphate-dependent enzyme [Metallococcus carri]NOP37946.1 aminotransferase class I/II-fold pyridoxal phosphate-dependent enzyme [Calidifontibacter sp. DB2511S]
MSAFDDHLKSVAAQRHSRGLTRRDGILPPGLIDLCSNDYLGLRQHPAVLAAAHEALTAYGPGAGASRLVSGTWPVHVELERALARHTGREAALVCSTGYHANLAAITALGDGDTLIVSDAHNHASIVDGCRLARGRVQVVPHLDLAAVEVALAERAEPRALVIVESVFSVLGDAAGLAALSDLVLRYDALLLVDEAHGLGVVGPGGEGGAAGLAGDHIVLTTSLSKSLAAQGGAVIGSALVREHLVNTARPYIFDTGLAPASAAAAAAALEAMGAERPARVRAVARRLADAAGVVAPAGAVLSVPMPGPTEALAAVERARAAGVAIGCFRPPSTPDGISRLRFTASAALSDNDIDRACAVVQEVVR